MLIACPTCGRLQFDMDTVVAEVERRLEAYDDPIEVSVLGCAVNGIGEARHADFGITGAKDVGDRSTRKGEPLKKVTTENLVDELFAEIDKYYAAGKRSSATRRRRRGRSSGWPRTRTRTAMTPERMAAMEAAAAAARRGRPRSPAGASRGPERRPPEGARETQLCVTFLDQAHSARLLRTPRPPSPS